MPKGPATAARIDLTDAEIADIMGRSENEVARIRRIDIDDVARTVAIGKRIARGV